MKTKKDAAPFRIPGGICSCGHIGGNNQYTQHAARFDLGHGRCMMKRCRCAQFTWVGALDHAATAKAEGR